MGIIASIIASQKKVKIFAAFAFFTFFTLLLLYSRAAENDDVHLSADLSVVEKELYPGDEILMGAEVILVRLENKSQKVDIALEYSLKNSQGIVLNRITETKGDLLRVADVQRMSVPTTAMPGVYSVSLTARYKDIETTVEENIVVLVPSPKRNGIFWTLGISVLGIALLAFWLWREHQRSKRLERQLIKVLSSSARVRNRK